MTQEDPGLANANQSKRNLSSKILAAVLSGDYQVAADMLKNYPTTMNTEMKEKLMKVFSSFVEFGKLSQKKDELDLVENEPQLDAIVDRYEAVLYDMGDLASEHEDHNTRIYLTIMAERLVELAKKFNNQVRDDRHIFILELLIYSILLITNNFCHLTAYQQPFDCGHAI
ncbi:hypothetical protein NQZ79_g8241 [Umbelopsis isabellina]|nr:hypothetical protein NQZ79_g8241 [Umbelopsis isabellina]